MAAVYGGPGLCGLFWPGGRRQLVSKLPGGIGGNNAITDFEKANRTAWDQVITGAGGTIMNTGAASATGDSYWASRETSSGTSAFYVRFGKPLAWDKANGKKTGARYIRAVRSISK